LQAHVKERVGLWKYPRWVEAVEELPKTAPARSSASSCARGSRDDDGAAHSLA
jgi:acyl-CoA synthetase (AMP-forming)/AMP-acid ligase II